jgi:hypothetical protein
MTEQTAETANPDGKGAPEGNEPAKTLTQADVDRIVAERVAREKGKFADYGDLKAKAAKFDELDQASKTEQERLTERLTTAEKRAAELESKALRLEVAAEKGLTTAQAKRLVGATREELEADADELLETFKPAEKAPPAVDLDLGTRTTAAASSDPRSADLAQIEADLKAAKRR